MKILKYIYLHQLKVEWSAMWKRHWIEYLINTLILCTSDYPELVWSDTIEVDEDFNLVYLRWKKVVVKKEDDILIIEELNRNIKTYMTVPILYIPSFLPCGHSLCSQRGLESTLLI